MYKSKDCPIAIIGVAYRAPGIGRTGIWEFLAEARSAWSKVPSDRFDAEAFYHPSSEKAGCISSQGAHFLPDDVYSFDAPFFGLKVEEARAVDPHHRMLLECAWEAAENAGLGLHDLIGSNTGVFAAIGTPEHAMQASDDLLSSTAWTSTGIGPCMHANRLSYFFGLEGPSVSLDTACASSSYAVHLACQSLRSGECSAAFVAGANLLLGPSSWSFIDTMGALSPEGRCFSYDKKASGYGRGEGAACIIVKRLEDALHDGDPIHALISNSACSHSGRSKGITMPSRAAEEKLLLRVHAEVGLDPNETAVVEGHGTGTQVGDPIEAGAFATVLAGKRTKSNPLYIGSLKSNFGHLEGASGILGIVKAVLMVKRGCVLPNAGFEELNENIEGRERLKVAETVLPWPTDAPKRVCVTNFGFGGSNAAVLVEGPPCLPQSSGLADDVSYPETRKCLAPPSDSQTHTSIERLVVISAKSKASLSSYLSSFLKYLENNHEKSNFVKHLAYTLGQRRTLHPYRMVVAADSIETLRMKLLASKTSKVKNHAIVFVFTGQGAQHAHMAAGLLRFTPFRNAIDQAQTCLREMGATWTILEELEKEANDSRIHEAEISQPVCTTVQLALVVLLRSWGVAPAAVTGHSSGEIAAAFAAGLISFRTAMTIAYFRGQAVAQLRRLSNRRGAMLALGASFEEATMLLEESASKDVTVAAINSPQSVTLSGDEAAIDKMQSKADMLGLFSRKLKVDVAYHSRQLEPIASQYLAAINPFYSLEPTAPAADGPRAVFVSSVTGDLAGADTVDASYWVKNLLQPVRFMHAIQGVLSWNPASGASAEQGSSRCTRILIEIGPHAALKAPIKQTIDLHNEQNQRDEADIEYLPSLVRGTESDTAILGLAGSLLSAGASLDLSRVNQTDHHNAQVLTDIPSYEWDKSARYIHKPQATRANLHPGYPYHSLLGRQIPSGGTGHVFKQVFTLDDLPWIRDHSIDGQIIFPMTGYLSLAVEATRRVSSTVPSAVLAREVHIKRSLPINEDERIEVTTTLRPSRTGTEEFSHSTWAFEITTWSDAHGWTTHCYGQVEAEANDMVMQTSTTKASVTLIGSETLMELNVETEYDKQSRRGLQFGPTFRSMIRARAGPEGTVVETELRDLHSPLPNPYGSPVSADPPTLDGFLHGASSLQELDGYTGAWMPTYMRRFRISNMIPAGAKQRFTTVSRLLDQDTQGGSVQFSTAGFAQCAGSLVPIVEYDSVTLRSIGSLGAEYEWADLPWTFRWEFRPSLDLADSDDLAKILSLPPADDQEREQHSQFNRASIYYMTQAVQTTADDDFSRLSPHLARFLRWARKVVAREDAASADLQGSLLADVSRHGAAGKLLSCMGERLVPVLRGEEKPLELISKHGLLLPRDYEQRLCPERYMQVLGKWAHRLSEARTHFRVLEVVGGSTRCTIPVLQELSRGTKEVPRWLNYTFTDASTGLLEEARMKLANWNQFITYKQLDIGQDPLQQGFEGNEYDLIIISNVLHTSLHLNNTIDNIRTLLKPAGKLLLLEPVNHQPLCLPLALLPGFWPTDDEYHLLQDGPLSSTAPWQYLLSTRGFSGIDGVVSDHQSAEYRSPWAVFASTKLGVPPVLDEADAITICGSFQHSEEEEFARKVAGHIAQQLGARTSIKSIADFNPVDDGLCIVVDSPRTSLWQDVSPESFSVLQNLLLDSSRLLWVIPEHHSPEAELVKGILRTLRVEDGSRSLRSLENLPYTAQGVEVLANIVAGLRNPALAGSIDEELVWLEGRVQVPRLGQQPEARGVFASEAGLPVKQLQALWGGRHRSLEMAVGSAGNPDSLYFRGTDTLAQELGEDEVLVRVEAAGVNFRDLLVVLDSIPGWDLGGEGAGVVLRAGSRVAGLRPGDRVLYLASNGGGFATHLRVPCWSALKIPDGLSNEGASSMPIAYLTAILSLIRVGRLQKGESLLVHAASGAVGQACIILAQHLGARIFATAGTPSKREFLQTTFGIPEEDIFSSRTPEFKNGILSATNGAGVDVIVNCLSGSLLQETWDVVADFGRFVEIGKKDLLRNSYLGMRHFIRNVTFSGIDLVQICRQRPEALKECFSEFASLLRDRIIVPIQPVTTLPISQMASGLRQLQSGQNIGKIVVTLGPDECVLAECLPALGSSRSLLSPDATYIITGGTGGIGLSLSHWMIENGARNVLVLGRSGSSRPGVKELLEKYRGTGVRVRAVACDIGSQTELKHALESIEDLPPVRGVVHGALYLRDSLWEGASYDDWQRITKPRIQGAWNLHNSLTGLDFFIILSSFVGAVGSIGQSIYAGTAAFFDAFSDYRRAKGLPIVSVALPAVRDVGYLAEHGRYEDLLKLNSLLSNTLTEAHLYTLIKGAILGPSSRLNYDSKAISLSFGSGGENIDTLPWDSVHPLVLIQRSTEGQQNKSDGLGQGLDKRLVRLQIADGGDPLPVLLEALVNKIASITMIEQSEVNPDSSLSAYSLDSLAAVELRNWIRREINIDLPLPTIVRAGNIRALATSIISQL